MDIDTNSIQWTTSKEAFPDHVSNDTSGLPLLVVENKLGHAIVSLQGAQILAFRPAGQNEMLWLSPKALFTAGKAIRGGIPLCLPWFGPGPEGAPAHGFARNSVWSLASAKCLENGTTKIVLELAGDAAFNPLWPYAFRFRLEAIIGNELGLTLTVENTGSDAAPLAFAFHNYFAVPDVTAVRISGLDDIRYVDKTDSDTIKWQRGDVTIGALTDRIYLDVPACQRLHTPVGDVRVESAMRCTIVWNAWNKDREMSDIGAGNHAGYVCVERGDVGPHAIRLDAGGRYKARMLLTH